MKKVCLFLSSFLLLISCHPHTAPYQTVKGFAQGGNYSIQYSPLREDGSRIDKNTDEIHELADSILNEIDRNLSGYNPSSLLSQVNANQNLQLNPIFIDLFDISKELYQETDAYFDVSGSPLFDIWGFGFQERQEITPAQIDSILNFVGMDKMRISPEGVLIKEDSRSQLNFNAIAQGYSCDLIGKALEKEGVCHYLVEVGMEILCKGLNSRGEKWKIGIDAPIDGNNEAGAVLQEIVEVSDCGIVTSGNYRKFYIQDGKKYSHTIDPKTGYPVSHSLLSATIIASNATLADAYATYCMVIGLEKAWDFLESRADLEGLLIYDDHGELHTYSSLQRTSE